MTDSDDDGLAVQQLHRREIEALRAKLEARDSQLAGIVLENYLQGQSLNAAFSHFYREHCDAFAGFSPSATFELRMTDIHEEFKTTLDTLLDARLAQEGITAEYCAQHLAAGVAPTSAKWTLFKDSRGVGCCRRYWLDMASVMGMLLVERLSGSSRPNTSALHLRRGRQ